MPGQNERVTKNGAMDDDRFPVLFEVSNERSHSLAGRQLVDFGGADRADVAVAGLPGHQLLFQVEFRDGAWTLLPWSVETTLSLNGNRVRGRVALQHRAIIQTGRHVFVFIEHEDASLSSARSANQWLVGLCQPWLSHPERLLSGWPFATKRPNH